MNVELQTVQFVDDGTPYFVVCDHNGYAWYIVGSLAAPEAYPIDIVHQDFTTARYYDGWTAGDVLVYDGIFADSLVELVDGLAYDKPGTEVLIVNSSATWSTEHRAQLRFEVDDVNGKPLPGVLCKT